LEPETTPLISPLSELLIDKTPEDPKLIEEALNDVVEIDKLVRPKVAPTGPIKLLIPAFVSVKG
jgi:hypothetical protein